MYRISKQFHFSAAHHLEGVPEGHQCGLRPDPQGVLRGHGHNYIVEVVLEANELDGTGFVTDYGDLAPIKRWIDTVLDHRDLNAQLPQLEGHTTAENLARTIFETFKDRYPHLAAVRVSETPKTWAEYRE